MTSGRHVWFSLVLVAALKVPAWGGPPPANPGAPVLIASGLEGASGSTIGPDGALYVTEGTAGRISRIDLASGELTTFASGLPVSGIPLGGAMDVAFVGQTAYVLVTLVAFDHDAENKVGIYRVDGPSEFTLIADLGGFSIDNPPDTEFGVPTGLQYAMEFFRGGFLVTDGHHNRVLQVTPGGGISVFMAFDNVVPTGLAVRGNTVYMAEAGPLPHLPEDGRVVALSPAGSATLLASGAPLLVDVEFGRGRRLYALSQGDWLEGGPEASPAQPNTGALVEVQADGTFSTVVDALNQPTSLEFVGTSAYVVTVSGEVWKIDGASGPPYGASH